MSRFGWDQPANLLVDGNCSLWICDYGLSRNVNLPPQQPSPQASPEASSAFGICRQSSLERFGGSSLRSLRPRKKDIRSLVSEASEEKTQGPSTGASKRPRPSPEADEGILEGGMGPSHQEIRDTAEEVIAPPPKRLRRTLSDNSELKISDQQSSLSSEDENDDDDFADIPPPSKLRRQLTRCVVAPILFFFSVRLIVLIFPVHIFFDSIRLLLPSHVVTRYYRAPELILLAAEGDSDDAGIHAADCTSLQPMQGNGNRSENGSKREGMDPLCDCSGREESSYTTAVDIWSAGCVFAELLGFVVHSALPSVFLWLGIIFHLRCFGFRCRMLVGSHMAPHQRVALFPGKSCYPLSASEPTACQSFSRLIHGMNLLDLFLSTHLFFVSAGLTKRTDKDAQDQLNVICNVIGTPGEADMEFLKNENLKRYLRSLPYRPKIDLRRKYNLDSSGLLLSWERRHHFLDHHSPPWSFPHPSMISCIPSECFSFFFLFHDLSFLSPPRDRSLEPNAELQSEAQNHSGGSSASRMVLEYEIPESSGEWRGRQQHHSFILL